MDSGIPARAGNLVRNLFVAGRSIVILAKELHSLCGVNLPLVYSARIAMVGSMRNARRAGK